MREKLLHTVLFTPISGGRWGLPLLLWGSPGTAKSAMVEAYAARWNLHCEVLSPGERGEGAFGVTPVPSADMASITYPAPDWTEKVKHGGVVFVDELTVASPALQAPMLGLIQARRIGSHQLHPRCRVIGAANPVELSAGGWDLTPPVANRLGHWDWQAPSADEWTTWLLGGAGVDNEAYGDAEAEEARVLKAWPTPFAKASGLITGFIRRRAELLHKMPPQGSAELSRAWPSPRSWEAATRAIAASEVHGLSEADGEMLVAAFVGRGAASELIAWKVQADLPDPADLLDGKAEFKFDKRRLDRTMAVYASCAALVAPGGAAQRKERTAKLWTLLAEATGEAMDVTIPAATVLVKAGLLAMVEAKGVLAKLEPMLSAAGLK